MIQRTNVPVGPISVQVETSCPSHMRSRKGLCLPMQVEYDRNAAALPRDCRADVNHVKNVSAPCIRELGDRLRQIAVPQSDLRVRRGIHFPSKLILHREARLQFTGSDTCI